MADTEIGIHLIMADTEIGINQFMAEAEIGIRYHDRSAERARPQHLLRLEVLDWRDAGVGVS